MARVSLPNAISMSRVPLAVLFGLLLFAGYGRVPLFACFAVAAVSDWFDGYFARKLGQATPDGAALDQYMDRIFAAIVVGVLVAHTVLDDTPPLRVLSSEASVMRTALLAYTRDLAALPGIAIALVRGKRLYHVETVGKVATFVQSVTLGLLVLGVPWVGYLAIGCAGVGLVAAGNYTRYALGDANGGR